MKRSTELSQQFQSPAHQVCRHAQQLGTVSAWQLEKNPTDMAPTKGVETTGARQTNRILVKSGHLMEFTSTPIQTVVPSPVAMNEEMKAVCNKEVRDLLQKEAVKRVGLNESTNVVKLKAKEFWDVSEYVVVVKGRFDLNGASFRCLNTSCEYHKEPVLASMPDYIGTIIPVMFKMASTSFSYARHRIEVDIKKREKMKCKCCVGPCLYSHFDVVMKLYRYESAGSGYMESLYGNEGIEFDEDIKRHIEVINSFKPQKRGHDSCGNSKYKAGRENVAKLSVGHPDHENFDRMSNEMTGGFLSVLHGRTHVWDCQVLHNGRWKHGAAASLGEEQEQVFAKLSRYGSVTKHMSPASRRDHLTETIFYHNEDKEQGMVNSLVKRLAKASKKVTEFSRKLQNSLALCGLQEKDLPITLKHLQESTLDKKKGYRMTSAWARKQMSQYGGKIRQCIALAKQTFKQCCHGVMLNSSS
ncbi:hypothetical protein OUZ56_029200 [Daphnia magna]|uniref:CxC3 like cysteine cluster domain-containing protein n=1 Tax=Daphnia magna TaxID=35525 RepID=A0ABR0B643_9CRUS|nr:hypothetical protein OUZ56_029200 [Daphnia magna]